MRESLNLLRESALEGHLVTDPLGKILGASHAAQSLFAQPSDMLIGRFLFSFIEKQQHEHLLGTLRQVQCGEPATGQHQECVLLNPGGNLDVELTVVEQLDRQGRVSELCWRLRDISERKRVERHLAVQYAVTRVFAESKTVGEAIPRVLQSICEGLGWDLGILWDVDRDANLIRFRGIWQAPAIQLADLGEICRNTTFSSGESLVGNVWQMGQSVHTAGEGVAGTCGFESMMRAAGLLCTCGFPVQVHNETIGVLTFSQQVCKCGGDLQKVLLGLGGMIGSFMERKRMEEKLLQLAAVFEASGDAIVGCDPHEIIHTWSPGAQRMFGYTAEEVKGKRISILLPPNRLTEVDSFKSQILRGLTVHQFETVRRRKDGKLIHVSVTVSPIQNAEGRLIGSAAVARDITLRKQNQEELRLAHEALERNREELRALTARLLTAQEEEHRRISQELHDSLNQKLALLMVDIETLARKVPASHQVVREQLESVHGRAVEISEDVHSLAYRLHPSVLDDLGLVVALQAYVREFAKREGVRINFTRRRLPDSISREASACLYRVTEESLDNVAKHAHAARVEITLTGRRNDIRLSIKDDGAGFDVELLKTHGKGLGILSMEERVRLVRGKLTIESGLGSGTHVVALVPAQMEVS